MKIKLFAVAAGPEFAGHVGDTIDVPDEQAADMIAGGYAEASEPPTPAETAEAGTDPAAETAEATPKKKKKA